MNFFLDSAQVFIPDNISPEAALARTTHLAIGAHQDDLEIMAIDGILNCFQHKGKWFSGVVMTDGRSSPRGGLYMDYTDDEMHDVRVEEQKKAAVLGEYAAQVFLEYQSTALKDATDFRPVEDLIQILKRAAPEVVYTHNPADKHDTHIGVLLKVLEAIKNISPDQRPGKLYGCEVWRDLDWLLDEDKVVFDTSTHENLQAALVEVFDSQVSGGKRYDLATMGRRRANATYHASHGVDAMTGAAFAVDLTPLIASEGQDLETFIQGSIERFANDVRQRIRRVG